MECPNYVTNIFNLASMYKGFEMTLEAKGVDQLLFHM